MKRFEDKKVLITGGSNGIGLATAQRLVAEGAEVLITGTNPSRVEAANQLDGIIGLVNDAGVPAAADDLAAAVKEKMGGRLDAVFLNAGFGRFQPLSDVSADEFDAQFNVNVKGPLLHAKALAPLLRDGGSIVLNTSVVNEIGMPGSAIYTGTKAALRGVTRVLARELAARQIRVNAVSPGPINTSFFARTGMPEEAVAGMAEQIQAQIPLGRFGKAEEVAAVAAFLLSDESSFVTGAEYPVDGGMTQL